MRIKVEYEIDVEDKPYNSNAFPRTRVYTANDASGASYRVPMDAIITEIPPPFVPGLYEDMSAPQHRNGARHVVWLNHAPLIPHAWVRVNVTPVED